MREDKSDAIFTCLWNRPHGITAKDMAVLLGDRVSSLNARLSKLFMYNMILREKVTGRGCREYLYKPKPKVVAPSITPAQPKSRTRETA